MSLSGISSQSNLTDKILCNVKNHESDPSISWEVDPSFVPKNPDHLEVKNWTKFWVLFSLIQGQSDPLKS